MVRIPAQERSAAPPGTPRAFPLLALVFLGLSAAAWPSAAAQEGSRGLPFLPRPEAEGALLEDLPPSEEWDEWVEPLAERGWAVGVLVIADSSVPFTGVRPRRRIDRALFDLSLEVDLEAVAGLRGTTFFAEGYAFRGHDASLVVGDAQIFSNIDNPKVTQLAELWIQHEARDGALRIKLGKADANSEFALVQAGLEFLHSSAGFTPTIFPFPSYPEPAVGLNVFLRPTPDWRLALGAYNAQDGGTVSGRRGMSASFDEVFWILQADRTWSEGTGRAAVGGWHHTGAFTRSDGSTDQGAEGAYALVEQRLWDRTGHPQVTGFLQWGDTATGVSPVKGHLAAGLIAAGLIPGLETWRTGLYASRATLRGAPGTPLGDELAIELLQTVPLTPHVTLKPDLQWIHDPAGVPQARDVLVGTLRLEAIL